MLRQGSNADVHAVGRIRGTSDLLLGGVPCLPSEEPTEALHDLLCRLRAEVDRGLSSPAPWLGDARRWDRGRSPERVEALARAFETLRARTNSRAPRKLGSKLLRGIHETVAGGGSYRTSGVRIGRFREFPPAWQVETLVERRLEQYRRDRRPVPLALSGLHLDLLSIHPFADGNGRSIRMLCSAGLLDAGYRSGLFTLVEQHFHSEPGQYGRTLTAYRDRRIDRAEVVRRFLYAMVRNAFFVAWLRVRERRMRALCARAGIADQADGILLNYDLVGRVEPSLGVELARIGPPWVHIAPTMSAEDVSCLRHQLSRLRQEEAASPVAKNRQPLSH